MDASRRESNRFPFLSLYFRPCPSQFPPRSIFSDAADLLSTSATRQAKQPQDPSQSAGHDTWHRHGKRVWSVGSMR